jgi:hypothetical protein
MKRTLLILAALLWPLAALAQNVTVIGPVTPGDCAQFSSTTIIKDAGAACGGGGGSPASPTGSVQFNNSGSFGGVTGATSDGTNLFVTTQAPLDQSTKAASTAYVNSATRVKLTAPRTYFWRSDGNDSFCTGLTNAAYVSGSFPQNCALLTTAVALSFIATLDFNGNAVTLTNGNGATYTTGIVVNKPWIGGGNLTIDLGGGAINESTTKAFLLTANLSLTGTGLSVPGVSIQNGTLSSSAFSCIQNAGIGTLNIGTGITLGACAQYGFEALGSGAIIGLTGANYTVTGGGLGHVASRNGGSIYLVATTVNCSGTIAYSEGFAVSKDSGILLSGSGTFPGCGVVTGPHYLVTNNGLVDAADATGTYFPGNASGTTSDSGIYGSGGSGVGGTFNSTAPNNFGINVSGVRIIDFGQTTANRTTIGSSTFVGGFLLSTFATGGTGYATGAGGAVTQTSSRTTTTPAINKVTGQITLVSAAGSATPFSFSVANTTIAATDTVQVAQLSGTDRYRVDVTKITAGTSFDLTITDLTGTTVEQPVFNFTIMRGVNN